MSGPHAGPADPARLRGEAVSLTVPGGAWPSPAVVVAEDRSPRVAIAALALTIVALPLLIPTLPGNAAPVDLVAIVAIVLTFLWAASARATIHVPYVVPMWIIVLAGSLAALLGSYPGAGSQAIAQDLFLLAWGAAVATAVRTPNVLATVVGIWSWSAIGWGGLLVLATLTGQTALAGIDPSQGSRAALTFGDQNGAAAYFVIALVVVLASGRPRRRAARTVAVAILLAALALTGSLAGIVSVAAVVVMVVLAGAWRRWGLAPAIAISLVLTTVLGGAVWFANTAHLVDEASASRFSLIRDSLGRGRDSAGTRTILARETAELFRTGPPIGRGPNSTLPSLESQQAPYPKEAHNDFIAAFVELGVVGTAGLLLLFGAVIWRTISVSSRPIAPAFAEAMPRSHLLVAALPSLLVFASTHEILHDRAFWTFIGLIGALHLWAGAEAQESGEPT